MLIRRWKPEGCDNFGDALVPYLASRLFPQRLADAAGTLYFIGTVLNASTRGEAPHVVLGAGTGYAPPPVITPDWRVYFVRGPRTSAALGGVPWITDPGILVHHFFPRRKRVPSCPCAFMPRWDSMSPELVESCANAGIEVIDPRLPGEQVIAAIQSTDLLLTEALHGAVVADVLRVPWISIYASRGHEFKWQDWCGSLEMIWNPINMEQFTLSWARDYAVPQLSAQSILNHRKRSMDGALAAFIHDIEGGRP